MFSWPFANGRYRNASISRSCSADVIGSGCHWERRSAGIVPFAAFNWWVANIRDMNGYLAYLMLTMEIPWATMFITLYLGQTTFFEDDLTSGRMLFPTRPKAIPGLLLFQVLLRGVCLLWECNSAGRVVGNVLPERNYSSRKAIDLEGSGIVGSR